MQIIYGIVNMFHKKILLFVIGLFQPRTEEETIDSKAEKLRYKEIKEQLRREKAKQKEKLRALKVRRIMIKDRSRASKCEADTSSDPGRRIKDNFRLNMAGVIVHYLNSYRKPDCKMGRITNTEDFKHLARKVCINCVIYLNQSSY